MTHTARRRDAKRAPLHLNADIETYENEMIQKFVMGQVPLTEFDTFIQTVKAMGCLLYTSDAADEL